jgi:hypothetical protein
MNTPVRASGSVPLLLALALAAGLPGTASAQSDLDASAAQAFLGTWSISLESPQGEFVMDLELTDASGKVAASIGSEMTGGMQDVTDVSLAGADLVLRYEFDAQGQVVPVAMTLAPNGEALDATMDFADGMFVMYGKATK